MGIDTDLAVTPLSQLTGITPSLAEKLALQRLVYCLDLLFILPLRYEDRTRITPIRDIRIGKKAQVQGVIRSSTVAYGRRRSFTCLIHDDSGSLVMRLYYFSYSQQQQLKKDTIIRCYGEPRQGRYGIEMYHPKYQVLRPSSMQPLPSTLNPIYPKIEGISNKKHENFVHQLLDHVTRHPIVDPLCERKLESISISDALAFVHRPPLEASTDLLDEKQHPVQLRLVRDELIAQRLSFLRLREDYKSTNSYTCIGSQRVLRSKLLQNLSFTPTPDQLTVEHEILADMEKQQPMLRLLQGDVGSGKTLVAALAALRAIENGGQCALMAPTELLAEQHYQQFINWFHQLGIDVSFVTSKSPVAEKRMHLQHIASGQAGMVIGTHAIIQQQVEFKKLVLVIIDEQHRFGVHQRLALRDKSSQSPHQLIMTATPIPRTLAMSLYADLDVSVIQHLPPGRKPIHTVATSNEKRKQVLHKVQLYCQQHQQVYWVCPLIEDSEKITCESAEQTFATMQKLLPDIRIDLVHGRLDAVKKQQIMSRFRLGEIQLLVATTVVEVGVDVPNANVMVIENAERLGLAQLHQLRGRVGRGGDQGYCILLYQNPLTENARQRLTIMRKSQSGFVIAEKDLQIRGPGEILGSKQAGAALLRIADLRLHQAQFNTVVQFAEKLQEDERKILLQRWFPNYDVYSNA